EEVFERHAPEAAAFPPLAVAAARILELAGGQRSALAHLPEHRVDVLGMSGPERFPPGPVCRTVAVEAAVLLHPPPEQRLVAHRQERRRVTPVLEEFAAGTGQVVQQPDVV